MAARSARRRGIVTTTLLAIGTLLATACNSVSGTPEAQSTGVATSTPSSESNATENADVASVDLDAISLSTSSAPQLGEVGVDGLAPEHADGVVALYEYEEGWWWATPVLVGADGPYLVAPVFPQDIGAGGSHELIFTDGAAVAGTAVPLDVGPMLPAPGAYHEAVDAARQLVGDLAAVMGGETATDWDSLAAMSIDDTPSHLLGLKFAQLQFSDDALAAVETLPAEDRDLLDAIFGAAEVPSLTDPGAVEALLALLPEQLSEESEDPEGLAAPRGRAFQPTSGPAHSTGRPVAAAMPQQSGATCIPLNLGGAVSPAELSALMIDSAVSAIAVDPNGSPAKIMAVLEGALLVGAGLETGATGGATVFGTVGAATAALKTIHEIRAGIYPSSFSKIDVTIDPDRFDEDHPFEEPGHWTSVAVQAMSTGQGFDQALFDAVTAAGSSLAGGIRGLNQTPDGWSEALGIHGKVGIQEMDELAYMGAEEIGKKRIGDELDGQPDTFHSCPETWSSDIAGKDWTWARPLEALFTVDNDDQSYHNWKEVGEDVLAIGPLPQRFGQKSIYQYLPVETEELEVLVGPAGGARTNILYVSSPGDPIDITAHIENAYDPTMQWTATAGEWADGGTVTTSMEEEATKRLITPKDAEEFGEGGIHVTIESMSRTGLRQSGNPPRYDFVRVRLAPFIVEPANGQVRPERELAYTATDREGKPVDAEWQATGGTIAKTGVGTATYTAGKKIGTFEVTAIRGSGGPDNTVTVPVQIIDDHCMVGTWELDSQPFVDALLAAAGSEGLEAGASMTYSGGTYRVTVESDGTTTDVRENWTMTMASDGIGSVYFVMNGTETGKWHIDPSDDDPNSGTLTVETTGGSINVEVRSSLGPLPFANSHDFPSENAMGSGSYTCSVDTLHLIVNADGHEIPATWFRVSGDGSEDGN